MLLKNTLSNRHISLLIPFSTSGVYNVYLLVYSYYIYNVYMGAFMESTRKTPQNKSSAEKRVVNLKYPVKNLALLDKAVKLRSHSDRTSYIIDAVTRAAENDLLDRQDFFLNDKDFASFKKMLDAPPKEIATLKALLKEKAPWEK